MAVHGRAQIGDLIRVDRGILGPLDRHIGGADLREFALIGYGEDDAPVGLLQDIGMIAVEQARHDDMAPLDQPHTGARVHTKPAEQFGDPGAGGIHHRPRANAAPVRQRGLPCAALAPGREQRGAGGDLRAVRRSIERVEQRQPRIVDPRIRIDKAAARAFQRRAHRHVAFAQAP